MITLYQMDVMKALKQMPSESVDMQITSPPYWGLRDYGVDGQIGLEPDFNDYIKKMCDIFDEVKRVLKKDGTCWVNLGDTYWGNPTGSLGNGAFSDRNNIKATFSARTGKPDPKLPERLRAREQAIKLDYKAKCVMMIPERFALEMINRGWILRNKIIWYKPNHMPTSVKDRFANSWEYLFMFVKSNENLFWTNNKIGKLVTKQPLGIQGKEKVDWEWRKCLNCEGKGCKSCKNLGKKKHNFWDGHCYYFDLDAVREPHKTGTPQADNDLKRMMSGRQEFQGMRSDCKYCGGTGIDPKTMNKCEDCKGKGRLHSVQKSFVAGNPKGRNPDDVIQYNEKYNQLNDKAYQRKILGIPHDLANCNPKGKNPDDIIKSKCQKYAIPRNVGKNKALHLAHDGWKPNLYENPLGKVPDDYWDITTQPYKEAHFAVFPEKLVERPIKTTKKNAVILDIFGGSGTTAVVARRHHRDCILIEIKKGYCDLIYKRLFGENQTTLVNSFNLIKEINK